MTAPGQQSEDQLQVAVANYLDRFLPDDATWCHVPNAGKRSGRVGNRLKAQGMKPGFPDCLIIHRGRAILIELKVGKNTLSKVQKEMKARLILAGAVVAVCWTLDEVVAFLNAAGIVKGRVAA